MTLFPVAPDASDPEERKFGSGHLKTRRRDNSRIRLDVSIKSEGRVYDPIVQ